MDNCFVKTLKNIWSFFLGSLRIILFLCCLIYLLIQLVSLFAIINVDHTQAKTILPESFTNTSRYSWIEMAALVFMTSLGCYGAFYKHHQCLKVFTILIVLYSCYNLLDLMLFTPKEIERVNADLQKKMSEDLKKYDWNTDNLAKSEANQLWDTIQFFGCCGMKGPEDWDDKRPSSVPKYTYPRTCCPMSMNKQCTKSDYLYETGCNDRIKQVEAMMVLGVCAVIFFQVTLGILTFFVSYLSIDRPNVSASGSPSMLESGNTNLGHGYQRFSGSVYVRQPPVNESFEPKGTTLYPSVPTAQDLEKEYSGQPPVYGSVMK